MQDVCNISPVLMQKCRNLPKVELHAHLNGSVKRERLRELARDCGVVTLSDREQELLENDAESLEGCFLLFDVIHKLTTTHDVITRVTQEVVSDFAEDNVVYLELRTTPKARPEHGITKQSYIEAVLLGMQRAEEELQSGSGDLKICVKLLLSIDRREGKEAALDTVRLAQQYAPRGVVGVDLSGNPRVGQWDDWLPALQLARASGLRLTLHGGEVSAPVETRAMLALRPDRLGHMCVLDQELEAMLLHSRIPVELCLTSNVATKSVAGYADHHFLVLHATGHPVVLCTDDAGVFATTLSREYALAIQAFALTDPMVHALVRQSVDYTFTSEDEKAALRDRIELALGAIAM